MDLPSQSSRKSREMCTTTSTHAPAVPQIQVRLKEMAVQAPAKSVLAGKVAFLVHNAGTSSTRWC
jgi:hypothetical protein